MGKQNWEKIVLGKFLWGKFCEKKINDKLWKNLMGNGKLWEKFHNGKNPKFLRHDVNQ